MGWVKTVSLCFIYINIILSNFLYCCYTGPNRPKLKNLDPTQPMGQPNPWTTLSGNTKHCYAVYCYTDVAWFVWMFVCVCLSVCLSICLSVGHIGNQCINVWSDLDAIQDKLAWVEGTKGKKQLWWCGAHWRHLANTMRRSIRVTLTAVVCRILCAAELGATLSEGFLILMPNATCLCWDSSVGSRHDATRICCWALATRRPQLLTDICCRRRRSVANPPAAAAVHRGTDRRTPDRYTDPVLSGQRNNRASTVFVAISYHFHIKSLRRSFVPEYMYREKSVSVLQCKQGSRG